MPAGDPEDRAARPVERPRRTAATHPARPGWSGDAPGSGPRLHPWRLGALAGLVAAAVALVALDAASHAGRVPSWVLGSVHDGVWLPIRAWGWYGAWPWSAGIAAGLTLPALAAAAGWVLGVRPLAPLHVAATLAWLRRDPGARRLLARRRSAAPEPSVGDARPHLLAVLEAVLDDAERREDGPAATAAARGVADLRLGTTRSGPPSGLSGPVGPGAAPAPAASSSERVAALAAPADTPAAPLLVPAADPAAPVADPVATWFAVLALDRASLVAGTGPDERVVRACCAALPREADGGPVRLTSLRATADGRGSPASAIERGLATLALLHLHARSGRPDVLSAALGPLVAAARVIETTLTARHPGQTTPTASGLVRDVHASPAGDADPLPWGALLPRAIERALAAGEVASASALAETAARLAAFPVSVLEPSPPPRTPVAGGEPSDLVSLRRWVDLRDPVLARALDAVQAASGTAATGWAPPRPLPARSTEWAAGAGPKALDVARRLGRPRPWDRFRLAASGAVVAAVASVSVGLVAAIGEPRGEVASRPTAILDDRLLGSHRRDGAARPVDVAVAAGGSTVLLATAGDGVVRHVPGLRHFATDSPGSTGGVLPGDSVERLRAVGDQIHAVVEGGGLAAWDARSGWRRLAGITPFPGLAEGPLAALAPTGDGRVLIAARGAGLAEYDPSTRTFLRVLGPTLDPALADPRALGTSGRETWAAAGGRLYQVDLGRGRVAPIPGDGLPGGVVAVAADGDRAWYAAASPPRIGVVERGRPDVRIGGARAPFGSAADLVDAAAVGPRLYLASRDGALHQYDTDARVMRTARELRPAHEDPPVRPGGVSALLAEPGARRLWLGGRGAVVAVEGADRPWFAVEGGAAALAPEATARLLPLGAFAGVVRTILPAAGGGAWAAADGPVLARVGADGRGVSLVLDGRPATDEDGGSSLLSSDHLRDAARDGTSLVLAFDTGVVGRYDLVHRRFRAWRPSGLPPGDPVAVAASPGGPTWLAYVGGIARVEGGSARYQALSPGPTGAPPEPRDVLAGSGGALVTTAGGGLLAVSADGSRVETRVGDRTAAPAAPLTGLVRLAGRWFLTTDGAGARVYDPAARRWDATFRAATGAVPEDHLVEAVADEGRVWLVGRRGGLAVTTGATPRTVLPSSGRAPDPGEVSAVAVEEGSAWFATSGAFHRYDPARRAWDAPRAGPPGEVTRILPFSSGIAARLATGDLWISGRVVARGVLGEAAGAGSLWVLTDRGLDRISPRGEASPALSSVPAAGLAADSLVDGAFEGESIWLATDRAVARYDGGRRAFDPLLAPPVSGIVRIAATPERVCVLTGAGAVACHGAAWELVEAAGARAVQSAAGRVFLIAADGGLRRAGAGGPVGGGALPVDLGRPLAAHAAAGAVVLVGERGIAAYDRPRRRWTWSRPFPGGAIAADAALAGDLYVLTRAGDVLRAPWPPEPTEAPDFTREIDAASATCPLDLRRARHAAALADDGLLLADGARVARYDAARHAWTAFSPPSPPVAVARTGRLGVAGTAAGRLYRVDPAGDGRWESLPGGVPGLRALASGDRRALALSGDGGLHAVTSRGVHPLGTPLAGPARDLLAFAGGTWVSRDAGIDRLGDAGPSEAAAPVVERSYALAGGPFRLFAAGMGDEAALYARASDGRVLRFHPAKDRFAEDATPPAEVLARVAAGEIVRAPEGGLAARPAQARASAADPGRRLPWDRLTGLAAVDGAPRFEAGPVAFLSGPGTTGIGAFSPAPVGDPASGAAAPSADDPFWRWWNGEGGPRAELRTADGAWAPLPLPASLQAGFRFPFDQHLALAAGGDVLYATTRAGLLRYQAAGLAEGGPEAGGRPDFLPAPGGGAPEAVAVAPGGAALARGTWVRAGGALLRLEGERLVPTPAPAAALARLPVHADALWRWDRSGGRLVARFVSAPDARVFDPDARGLRFSFDRPLTVEVLGGLVFTRTPAGDVAVAPDEGRLPVRSLRFRPTRPSPDAGRSSDLPFRLAASSDGRTRGLELVLADGGTAPLRVVDGRLAFDVARGVAGDGASTWVSTEAGVVRYPAGDELRLSRARVYRLPVPGPPPRLERSEGGVRARIPRPDAGSVGGARWEPFRYDAAGDRFVPDPAAPPPGPARAVEDGPVRFDVSPPTRPGDAAALFGRIVTLGGPPVALDLAGGAWPFDRLRAVASGPGTIWMATDAGLARISTAGPVKGLAGMRVLSTPDPVDRLAWLGEGDGVPEGLHARTASGRTLRWSPGADRLDPASRGTTSAAAAWLDPGVEAAIAGRLRARRTPGGPLALEYLSRDRGWVGIAVDAGRLALDRFRSFALQEGRLLLATPAGVLVGPEDPADLTRSVLWAGPSWVDDLLAVPGGVVGRSRSDAGQAVFLPRSGLSPHPHAGPDPFLSRPLAGEGPWRLFRREERAAAATGTAVVGSRVACALAGEDGTSAPCDPSGGRFPFDDVRDVAVAGDDVLVATAVGLVRWAKTGPLSLGRARVLPLAGGADRLLVADDRASDFVVVARGAGPEGAAPAWRLDEGPGGAGARLVPIGTAADYRGPGVVAGDWVFRPGFAGWSTALRAGGSGTRTVHRGRFADDVVLDVAVAAGPGPPWRLTEAGVWLGGRRWPAPPGATQVVEAREALVFLAGEALVTLPLRGRELSGPPVSSPLPPGVRPVRLERDEAGSPRLVAERDGLPATAPIGPDGRIRGPFTDLPNGTIAVARGAGARWWATVKGLMRSSP